jgi:VIT1/CCC1 family predicted Fe2+/Mn2+ transporter
MSAHKTSELHFISRIGWLRAAVLGANDGIVSTAALIVGVAASAVDKNAIWLTGVAGLVAGALSMAAGEYVSVSSQADTEAADLRRETEELKAFPQAEQDELRDIYIQRGLTPALATEVAGQLMAHNALEAHARDELGLSEHTEAKPVQAALASALTFASGALLPLIAMVLVPETFIIPSVSICALVFLALLGAIGAKAGGADVTRAMIRVTFWGAIALGVTAGIGRLFGAVV